jgi:hypothetical protein
VESINVFVDEMAIARVKIYEKSDLEKDYIGEQTFEWAKLWLCPLWPIC